MKKMWREQSNKGLSLVELIVAVSIGAIVAASIAALITYSIRVYHNESVNTAMQYEIQTNVNQALDAIMSSSGVVIKQESGKTQYAGFGKFEETRNVTTGAVTKVVFTGVVLASGTKDPETGKFDIYLRRTTQEGTDASLAVAEAAKPLISPAGDKRPYLLGQNAKAFDITIDTTPATSSCIVEGYTDETKPGKYINPLLVKVSLEFEKDGTGKTINKKVSDNAIMRNQVTADIWIDGKRYVLKK